MYLPDDTPQVEFHRHGNTVQLLHDFTFVDSEGRHWTAERGAVVNGASIPRFFWRFIGPPMGSRYMNASIIHDFFCTHRIVDSWRVHRAFYEAMRESGVEWWRASLMYWAVRLFGPRFEGKS